MPEGETLQFPMFDRNGLSPLTEPLRRCVRRTRRVGRRSFPTRRDYEDCAIELGLARNRQDIWSNGQLVNAVQNHWFTLGQSGCVFAQYLIKYASAVGWKTVICPSPSRQMGARQLASRLETLIADQVASPHCELLSLLFPKAATVPQFENLIKLLLRLKCVDLLPLETTSELVGLSLRINLTCDRQCQSWVLGFGPFHFFPVTRQAPVTEIVIRTKPKVLPLKQDGCTDLSAAHVADVPLEMDARRFALLWNASIQSRRAMLGSESGSFARARFTFSVPRDRLSWLLASVPVRAVTSGADEHGGRGVES
jgi:hypothetical protein